MEIHFAKCVYYYTNIKFHAPLKFPGNLYSMLNQPHFPCTAALDIYFIINSENQADFSSFGQFTLQLLHFILTRINIVAIVSVSKREVSERMPKVV